MKGLPYELAVELAKEYHHQRHLFKLSFVSPLYFTDADIDIYYDSRWWYSRGIEFDAVKLSASPRIDNISFAIDNVDKTFTNIVLEQETRGKECIIYRIALDRNMNVIGSTILFLGYLDAIEIDKRRARFQVYNHFIRWKMLTPRRFHSATCQWTFKSTYCGYGGGETWCDHSWERCVALGQKLNFSGFRWLPFLVEKQIWWGRIPK